MAAFCRRKESLSCPRMTCFFVKLGISDSLSPAPLPVTKRCVCSLLVVACGGGARKGKRNGERKFENNIISTLTWTHYGLECKCEMQFQFKREDFQEISGALEYVQRESALLPGLSPEWLILQFFLQTLSRLITSWHQVGTLSKYVTISWILAAGFPMRHRERRAIPHRRCLAHSSQWWYMSAWASASLPLIQSSCWSGS